VIFCTVGTHEQQQDRLLRALDALPGAEEIRAQTGWCTYVPTRVKAHKLMAFDELQAQMREARIVVTHGGPASIMQALSHGKIPIVVPRQSAFGEHVDDHQVRFARKIADRVLVVLDIDTLPEVIASYDTRVAAIPAQAAGPERARAFAERFDVLCADVVRQRPSRWRR
jgi:UDP-N-acetylglucosamine transferase subunit ALG13